MCEAPFHGATLVGLGKVKKDRGAIFKMPLPPSLSGDKIHRSMLVTLTWFSPVEPTRARYRLAALEALAAEDDNNEDKDWYIAMKSEPPPLPLIKRGTVWSRRLIHKRVHTPEYDHRATLPIRVQCRDASGGGLDQDLDISFAIAVTLEVAASAEYDVREEIRNQLMIRLREDRSI